MQISITTIPTIINFKKKLKEKENVLDKNIKKAIELSAFAVEGESKKLVPTDTGRLKNSIYTSIYKDYAVVQPKTNYALYVHNGTKYMKGRPFMTDGVRKAETKIVGFFELAIKNALKV